MQRADMAMGADRDRAVPPFPHPSAGFQWTPEFQALLPVVRGLRVPPLPTSVSTAPEAYAELLALWGTLDTDVAYFPQGPGRNWRRWSDETARQHLTRAWLQQADVEQWLEASLQIRHSANTECTWALQQCLALRGLSFTFDLLLALGDLHQWGSSAQSTAHWTQLIAPIVHAIAAADASLHADLLSRAQRAREVSPHQRLLCAHLFPEQREWASECFDFEPPFYQQPVLMALHLSPSELRDRLAKGMYWSDDWRSALLLHAHLHGAAAFDAFAAAYAYAIKIKARDGRLAILFDDLLRFEHPRQPEALAEHVAQRNVREALAQLATRYPVAVLVAAIPTAMRGNAVEEAWIRRLAVEHPDALQVALPLVDQGAAVRLRAALAGHAAPKAATPKPLRERPDALLRSVAASHGIDADTLADRLVPTLGLEAGDALVLDFGPRQFRVRFDETLDPWLEDEARVRLKAIPRPNAGDDAAKAEAAIARFKALRKAVAEVAKVQVARLERAMVQQRRWAAPEFLACFVRHPLMRHLAARLLWAVHDGKSLGQAFRIAEDGTLADAQDRAWVLPSDAMVVLPHALDLPKAQHDAFAQVFADYEIAQPFRQLGRESFVLGKEDARAHQFVFARGHGVSSTSLLGLRHRGWVNGDAGEAITSSFEFEVRPGLRAELHFAPGVHLMAPKDEPVQRLQTLVLRSREKTWKSVPFSELTRLEASEVVRDVQMLGRV